MKSANLLYKKVYGCLIGGLIGDAMGAPVEGWHYEKIYENRLMTIMCDSRETVPCALALFHLAGGNPEKAIIYAANFGRDADTIATMVGAVSGAYAGVDGLRRKWVEEIQKSSPEQENLTNKLIEVIEKKYNEVNVVMNSYKKLC